VNKLLKADKIDLVRLAQLKLSLQEKLDTLKQFDSEVLELTDDEGVEAEIQSADDYKDGIYSALVGIDESSMKLKPRSVSGTPPPADTVHAATPPAGERENRIKLPKLTIRPLKGILPSGRLSGICITLRSMPTLASPTSISSII
jgi:hypothetical protein